MGQLLRRTSSAARKHKWALLIAASAVAVGSAVVTIVAIQGGAKFLGTTAAGSHEWWQDFGDQAFCERCHVGVATELTAGPHVSPGLSDCTFCHGVPSGASDTHAASPAKCADCHHKIKGTEKPAKCVSCHADVKAKDAKTGAPGFKKAFHGKCQTCHKKQKDKPELKKCTTCHPK